MLPFIFVAANYIVSLAAVFSIVTQRSEGDYQLYGHVKSPPPPQKKKKIEKSSDKGTGKESKNTNKNLRHKRADYPK